MDGATSDAIERRDDSEFGDLDDFDDQLFGEEEDGQVEDDTLDPFTAAAAEESAEDDFAGDVAFTQKLLTNAQTLKQFYDSQTKAPVEVEYDYGDDEPYTLTQAPGRPRPSHNEDEFLPLPDPFSQPSTSSPPMQYALPSLAKSQDVPRDYEYHDDQDREAEDTLDDFGIEEYRRVQAMSDGDFFQGRYEMFEASYLKHLDLARFERVTQFSRRYVFSEAVLSFPLTGVCMKILLAGRTVLVSPVFLVEEEDGDRCVLSDAHLPDEKGCQMIALAEIGVTLPSFKRGDVVCLLEFYVDHGVVLSTKGESDDNERQDKDELDNQVTSEAKDEADDKVETTTHANLPSSRKVTLEEALDESFFSSGEPFSPDPFPPDPNTTQHASKSTKFTKMTKSETRTNENENDNAIVGPSAILVIKRLAVLDLATLNNDFDQDRTLLHQDKSLETKKDHGNAQTVEADADASANLDMADFPVEVSFTRFQNVVG